MTLATIDTARLVDGAKLNAITTSGSGTLYLANDGTYKAAVGAGLGDVNGPASSTDNAIARFDLSTGKVIQNSTVTLDDDGNVLGVNGVQLDTTPTADSFSTGKIRWNNQDGTMDVDTDVSGVTIQVGQETVVRVLNKTGSTITNGSVVYINGAQGNRPTIAKVGNTDLTNGEKVIGVVTADILDNAQGYVTTQGLVRDLNTNSYSVGDTLWMGSTAGTFTNTEPAASSLIIKIGEVVVAHPTQGVVNVHVENPFTSTVLKNMGATTTEWTGFYDNANISVSGDSSTRTVTLTRTGGLIYYFAGKRFTQTSPYTPPAHGNVTSSVYFGSFDSTGTFSWSTTGYDLQTQAPFAIARYDSTAASWVYTDEVHGLVMDWATHENLHNNVGSWLKSGGALTGGTYAVQPVSPTDADNTPGVDSAILFDEDAPTTINAWTQGSYTTLRFVSSVATYATAASLPFRVTGTYPNINTGGTSEAETVTGRFFNVYVVLVPVATDVQSQKYRVLWVQPQTAYTTSAAAQAEQFSSLNLGNLGAAFQEYLPRHRITYATSASYTGATGRCRIDAVTTVYGTRTSSAVSATPAAGTTGDVQVNSGGAFSGVSPSTSGYVLTSNGAGVAPSFQAAAGGGFLETSIANYEGPAVVGILGRYTATRTGTLGSIRLVSDSLPVGSNCIAELRKNSTTSGNVLSATLQITTTESATNGQYIGTAVSSFSSTAIAAGDVFYVYLTGVGSTTPASNVRALLYTT